MMAVPHPNLGKLRRWDPERIGPFALLGRLGAGAMGQVYLGRSQAGRLVAVKTIKIELAEEPGFRDHFAHEVAAARRVSGMFTAAVVAADPEADVPWLATAYVPVPSLSRLVRSVGPQPVPAVWWLAAGCAEALESIHGAGLVHRDLKPSNVLVAPSGPLVIDFGVARAAERIQLTLTRGAVGTPAYMAPEQARDTRQASMASDMFALGATLLYAATGHAPYQGETVMDVLVRLATEPPDLAGLPPELTELITGCLERSPRDRPTAAVLVERLGPRISAAPHADGLAPGAPHPFLAEPAMALIDGFRSRAGNGARPAPAQEADDEDPGDLSQASLTGFGSEASDVSQPSSTGSGRDGTTGGLTYASQLAGSVPGDPALHPGWQAGPPPGAAAGAGSIPPGTGTEDSPPGPAGGRHQAMLSLPVRAAAAAALLVAGAALGAILTGFGMTGGSGGSAHPSGSSSASPGARPASPPPPPASSFSPIPTGPPGVKALQPLGDRDTTFLLHGANWRPGTHLTIEVAGVGISSFHPVVDRVGTFNYAINQDDDIVHGRLPLGKFQVIVTGPDSQRATVKIQVTTGPPPRGQTPPPGQAPPPPPGG
ncbi:MAG TPA: serine/threonine-protein kinase [Streptosporangiaceae bacterium]